MGDLFGVGSPAYVEEVCRQSASVLDDIHGGHGQSRAIHHAADVPVELDVIQTVLGGLDFERIFLGDVAQFAKISMPEQSVVVEIDLGIQSKQTAIGATHKRINFHQGRICLLE